MSHESRHRRTVPLSLPPAERWTLHHVLLTRIEQETTAEETSAVDPPPIEVFQAFETLDRGDTEFTVDQLEAMETVLSTFHHRTTWWELERSRLERLLHQVTERLENHA